MGINNQTVAAPLIFPRHTSGQDGAPFPDRIGAVARASQGLLPPPFWMNVVLTSALGQNAHAGYAFPPAMSIQWGMKNQ